ncbi:MAG: ABC transporter permease [Phycisphaerales bacterium]
MRRLPLDYAVRNLGRSHTRLALAVIGSTLVALLTLAAGAFVRGMTTSLQSTGGEHNVIIVGTGSEESVERSEIGARIPGLIGASIQGIQSRGSTSYLSPEVYVQLIIGPESDPQRRSLAAVRGVTPTALLVHSGVRLTEGRFPRAGEDEVMLGAMTHVRLGVPSESIAVGKSLMLEGRPWEIVGTFDASGTIMQAEVWAPLTDIKEATKRETISCVVMTLDPDRAEFGDVDYFCRSRIDLELSAMRESEYYAGLSRFFAPIRFVAWATAGLIGLGGLFGGLNTMYAAFAARVREVGMLQSLGYRRGAVVLSLVQESVIAASAGGLLACVAGLLVLDGLAVRFSMGAFGLVVDESVLLVGLGASLVLGIVGALPPAWKCLTLPIPQALKGV